MVEHIRIYNMAYGIRRCITAPVGISIACTNKKLINI
jgi:hypothetical protein